MLQTRKGFVISRPFYSDGGRGQVDHQSLAREEQPGVLDGSLNAVLGFLDGFIGWPTISIHG